MHHASCIFQRYTSGAWGPRVRGSERIGAIKRGGVNTQEERHNLVRRVWNKLRKIQKFSQAERGGALGGWARLAGDLDLGLSAFGRLSVAFRRHSSRSREQGEITI